MVYFRLNRSMQARALRHGLALKQKAGEVFFCNSNARACRSSPRPIHAKHAAAGRSMALPPAGPKPHRKLAARLIES
jgi:hypothetical protein